MDTKKPKVRNERKKCLEYVPKRIRRAKTSRKQMVANVLQTIKEESLQMRLRWLHL